MTPTILVLLVTCVAGAVGAICRYCLDAIAKFFWSKPATVFVNLLGCFLIGLLAPLTMQDFQVLHYALTTGFLGGFTTFSTAMLEAINTIREQKIARGLALAILPVVLGMALCGAGMAIAAAWL
ncbi:hypothetical protein CYJ19_08145 [Winkia neuii]|uniref:Fluoride-specific ion channel FluC n=1 Tax=Winkia neuii TaxID=33007 RepID=A0A2I1IM07_9ACTO|nr:CrcB family protein [Winkia neuii]PKY72160.1 hypothetical protein CYJ19_08145 [Winkia neuii]